MYKDDAYDSTGATVSASQAIVAPAYGRIQALIAEQRCVILDGGTATELNTVVPPPEGERDEPLWGTWALLHAPDAVLDVHRRYVDIGCDVVSTNTWGLTGAAELERIGPGSVSEPLHWMDVARRGVRVGREAIARGGRVGEVALAFSINGDIDTLEKQETLQLLARVLEEEPPDLLLLETMTLIRDELTFATVELMLDTGLPVWLSFRRCRHGVCGVYGQHWGGPEGDVFGRAARRFEEMGVGALLINCVPPDHVPGVLPWLRDFTDLPLGVYPNLGYYTSDGWSFDRTVGPRKYAELALSWRDEGADIIGGCCGVRPQLIAAMRDSLARARPRRRRSGRERGREVASGLDLPHAEPPVPAPWTDARGRRLFPLPFPDIIVEPGVFVPTQGSFLGWKHLFEHAVGADARCLDIGCGTGILAVQLALNGAESVHAIDVDRRAVANTLANAFRNGVADRVTGGVVDLYPWVPEDTYDVVVASLYQMPVDPFERPTSHRPLDFWGRNLIDHLISLLPTLLAEGGVAYIMQLSILGQLRTQSLLERHGMTARVVEFSPFPFTPIFSQRKAQIERVEELSDAYHLKFGDGDVMVAYLLEVRAQAPETRGQLQG
jgi:S-methylmethionine-dependent homocysteine/selenocysteine methylase/SAM-dependent methyltransferase